MKKLRKKLLDRSGLEIARLAARAALDKKAEDLVILDVQGISSFTDYFVIMTGRSTRHVQGLAHAIDEALGRKRVKATNSEGMQEGLWVLLDYNDVVVHIFYETHREFFNLEGLWHDALRVPVDGEGGKSQEEEG